LTTVGVGQRAVALLGVDAGQAAFELRRRRATNQYFLGPGKHLPGGAPEMVVESIPTKDADGITTLTEVFFSD
jgi:hypothetical protein